MKTRLFLKKEMVQASITGDIIPTLLLTPILYEDHPHINLLRNQMSEEISDEIIEQLESDEFIVNEENGNMVIYCNDGETIHIIELLFSKDVRWFFKRYMYGGFIFELKREETSEKEFYIMRPDTLNLLDSFSRSVN